INDEEYDIDLAAQFESKVIVVCNLYLGSINHSLLTMIEVQRRKLDVLGIIFNGPSNPESEDIILKKSPWPCLLRVSQEQEMTASLVSKYAQQLRADWGKDFEKIQDQPMLSI
ncbi:MAG: AAA family ATPase, partial [Bacteroidota bacterium]